MTTTAATPTVPGYVNVIVKALLRTPLLHRLLSHNTMLLSVTGRTTGTTYTFPVSYQRDGEIITCYTDHGWWKNLRGGAPVGMVVAGRRLNGDAAPVTQDHQTTIETLRAFLLRSPRDAKYHGVRVEANGDLNPEDLERAAQTSTMVQIRLPRK